MTPPRFGRQLRLPLKISGGGSDMSAIDTTDPAAMIREANRRQQLRAAGASTFGDPAAAIARSELEESAREKAVEHEGDRIMGALGFIAVRFSHPGKTKQTPGIPDRKYYHERRRLTLWWEAKAEWGKASPAQTEFHRMAKACGEHVVVGTHADLLNWLMSNRICRVESDGTITPIQE